MQYAFGDLVARDWVEIAYSDRRRAEATVLAIVMSSHRDCLICYVAGSNPAKVITCRYDQILRRFDPVLVDQYETSTRSPHYEA